MGSHTYYECHVTLLGTAEEIRPKVEVLRWKFSCIDGDPVLGEGVRCYATRHFNPRLTSEMVQYRLHACADALTAQGLVVTRRKVELVIYDDRSTRTQCGGGCVECHLDDLANRLGHEHWSHSLRVDGATTEEG